MIQNSNACGLYMYNLWKLRKNFTIAKIFHDLNVAETKHCNFGPVLKFAKINPLALYEVILSSLSFPSLTWQVLVCSVVLSLFPTSSTPHQWGYKWRDKCNSSNLTNCSERSETCRTNTSTWVLYLKVSESESEWERERDTHTHTFELWSL